MKHITITEFNKKVEMEAAFLVRIDGVEASKAQALAYETVSQEYTAVS